ncbi:MAG TPA: hypothetical protein VM869_17620 [Enhygromyxa sp.]|nr:hypothetical protein [Enhygromyxa sp.]
MALTFSLTGFLVGGPLADVHHQEVGQQDRASDGDDVPSTWLGRWNQRADKRAVGSDFVWIPPEELEPLAARITWIERRVACESEQAPTAERWRATPVRGPPSSSARVFVGS